MKNFLIKLYDFLLSYFIFLTGWALIKYRKRGAENLPLVTKTLSKIRLYPLIDHYYEPKFIYSNEEKDLYLKRNLSSIVFDDLKQIKYLENLKFKNELIELSLNNKTKKFNFVINNGSFEEGDAEIYYQMIRYLKPNKILEVGSGHSTLIGLEAVEQNKIENKKTLIKCIEPYENKWLSNLDVEVIRQPLEKIDKNWNEELNKDDIFFLDSSHIIKPGGDVLKFYQEILPSLKSGVIVHIHDIFTPKNYLPNWTFDKYRLWNEQYLLESILSNSNKYEVILSLNFLKNQYFENLSNKCPYLKKSSEPGSIYLKII
tara:strand:- start:5049 stop:5993 length:945 start_codon:yes stop_codon:yes gene_type:complete